MNRFFNYDTKLFRILRKILEAVCLGSFWVVFSIPIITIGASTSALYYSVNKVIRHDRGYMWQEFWSAFKANLKQSIAAELILLLLTLIGVVDCYVLYHLASTWSALRIVYVIFLLLVALVIVWASYVFPYIARFQNTTKAILENCAMIVFMNMHWSILLFAMIAVSILAIIFVPLAFLFVPVIYMVLANLILERVFRKYMSEEDLAAEEERNMKNYDE